MKYNEWRDELKSNLLCVSESERRRVLDYYAEAYADRRDAGFTEREIIDDFGAPYDAAQRILSESGEYYEEPAERRKSERRTQEIREERARDSREEPKQYGSNSLFGNYSGNTAAPAPAKTRGDYTWILVLLCIIFAIPIAIVVICMVGVTVGFCVAPISVIISGVATLGLGIGELFSDAVSGAMHIGAGLIVFGVGIILAPLFFLLVKWMWKLFGMFFSWLSRVFSGKEKTK